MPPISIISPAGRRRSRSRRGSCSCARPAPASTAAPVESTGAAEVRVGVRPRPPARRASAPARSIATQWAPVRLATATASAMWSHVAVGDAGCGSARRRRRSRFADRVVRRQERVDQHRASPSASSNVAWPMKRISISVLLRARFVELLGQRPADRDPDHHPHPRLLGEQRAERRRALARVLELERLAPARPRAPRRTSRRPRAPGRGSAAGSAPRGRPSPRPRAKRSGARQRVDRRLELARRSSGSTAAPPAALVHPQREVAAVAEPRVDRLAHRRPLQRGGLEPALARLAERDRRSAAGRGRARDARGGWRRSRSRGRGRGRSSRARRRARPRRAPGRGAASASGGGGSAPARTRRRRRGRRRASLIRPRSAGSRVGVPVEVADVGAARTPASSSDIAAGLAVEHVAGLLERGDRLGVELGRPRRSTRRPRPRS